MHDAAAGGGAGGRLWLRLLEVLSAIGTGLIVVVMVAMDLDVLGRAVLGRPLAGVTEIVTMSIAAIVFLQLPAALAGGRFVRSDALLGVLLERRPRWAAMLGALWNGLGALAFALVGYAAAPLVWKDWQRGEMYGVPGIFTFPRWPVGAVIVLGCVVTALQFALMVLPAWRGRRQAGGGVA